MSRGTSVVLLLVYFLYLVFQLNSHAYMYESTPQHIIERESHPGPAASYFNSSSSSSSDSSSSSSSNSDDSDGAPSTARRIKRAMKGKRSRKQSVIASDEAVAIGAAPISPQTAADAGVSIDQSDFIQSLPDPKPAADDEGDEVPKMKSHRKKRKHKRHTRTRDSTVSQADGETVPKTVPGPSDEARRVDFALSARCGGPDRLSAEAVLASHNPPDDPKTISQTVFSRPQNTTMGENLQRPGSTQYNLRRTNSLPIDHRSYRNQPGAIPPIVPRCGKRHAEDADRRVRPRR